MAPIDLIIRSMYIRFFAATDTSPTATFALGYLRALMALAPVRVVSLSAGFLGTWEAYAELMATPMSGAMVNCVCGPPSTWSWLARIAAPQTDLSTVEIEEEITEGVRRPTETITGAIGLYTADAYRNVMFFCDLPTNRHQTAELGKFPRRITPVPAFRDAIAGSTLIPVPVADPAGFRELVLGKVSA